MGRNTLVSKKSKKLGQGKPALQAAVLSFALKFKPNLYNSITMSFYSRKIASNNLRSLGIYGDQTKGELHQRGSRYYK